MIICLCTELRCEWVCLTVSTLFNFEYSFQTLVSIICKWGIPLITQQGAVAFDNATPHRLADNSRLESMSYATSQRSIIPVFIKQHFIRTSKFDQQHLKIQNGLEIHQNERVNACFLQTFFKILSMYYAYGIIIYGFNRISNETSLSNGVVSCDRKCKI